MTGLKRILLWVGFVSAGVQGATFYSISTEADRYEVAGFSNQIQDLQNRKNYYKYSLSTSQYVSGEAELVDMTKEEAIAKRDTSMVDWCTNGMNRFKAYIPPFTVSYKITLVSFPNDNYIGFYTFVPDDQGTENRGVLIDETSNLTVYRAGGVNEYLDALFGEKKTVQFVMRNTATINLTEVQMKKYGIFEKGGYLYVSMVQANELTVSSFGHIRRPRVGVSVDLNILNNGANGIAEDILGIVPVGETEPYEAPLMMRTRECKKPGIVEVVTEEGSMLSAEERCALDPTNTWLNGKCYSANEYACMTEGGEWRSNTCISAAQLECEKFKSTRKWSSVLDKCLYLSAEAEKKELMDADGNTRGFSLAPFVVTKEGWITKLSLYNTNSQAPVVERVRVMNERKDVFADVNVTLKDGNGWSGRLVLKNRRLRFENEENGTNVLDIEMNRDGLEGVIVVEPIQKVHALTADGEMEYVYSSEGQQSSSYSSAGTSGPCAPGETYIPSNGTCIKSGGDAVPYSSSVSSFRPSTSSASVSSTPSKSPVNQCKEGQVYIPSNGSCVNIGSGGATSTATSSSSAPSAAAGNCGPNETFIISNGTCVRNITESSSSISSVANSSVSSAVDMTEEGSAEYIGKASLPRSEEALKVRTYLEEMGVGKVAGYFVYHDFENSPPKYDWAYVEPDGTVYQLRGKKPTEYDVFGFKKRKDVHIDANSGNRFLMIAIYQWSEDADDRFSWLIVDDKTGEVNKLSGVTKDGIFDYTESLGLYIRIEGDEVHFATKIDPQQNSSSSSISSETSEEMEAASSDSSELRNTSSLPSSSKSSAVSSSGSSFVPKGDDSDFPK